MVYLQLSTSFDYAALAITPSKQVDCAFSEIRSKTTINQQTTSLMVTIFQCLIYRYFISCKPTSSKFYSHFPSTRAQQSI